MVEDIGQDISCLVLSQSSLGEEVPFIICLYTAMTNPHHCLVMA